MIGKNIKRLRREKGYSQEQLARKLNVTQGAVSHWENGTTYPEAAQLLSIAELFGVTLDQFTDDSPVRDFDAINIRRSAIPIIGEIACGTPITAEQNIEGYADLPDGVHADFALRCKGDSMEPTFLNGDLVLIRKQPEVENGQIAAIGIQSASESEAMLKRFYLHENGILCVSDNPKYAPLHFSDEDAPVIYGLAIGYTRMFN